MDFASVELFIYFSNKFSIKAFVLALPQVKRLWINAGNSGKLFALEINVWVTCGDLSITLVHFSG
jgi:hypothetical protein